MLSNIEKATLIPNMGNKDRLLFIRWVLYSAKPQVFQWPPIPPGPFKPFLEALNNIQRAYSGHPNKHIRTALVTARSAPAHKRAIKTLRAWGIGVDEAFFLGGWDKAPILDKFRPHIFFDDQQTYCQNAARYVPTGHVPSGIKNL